MIIKKFVARDFKTAIKQAKEEMGRDAIILHTSQVRKGGILSFFFRPQVEITVAMDDSLKVSSDKARKMPLIPVSDSLVRKSKPVELPTAEGETDTREKELLEELQRMKQIMTDVKLKMYEVEFIKGMSENVQFFYEILINNKVEKDLALKIVNSVEARLPGDKSSDESWAQDVCLHTLQEYFSEAKPISLSNGEKGKLVFLVGPTGVGKTTTIAKLAANLAFSEGKEVALITLDTYRVSAAEQLRTYAEIIDIPISIVFNSLDLEAAIKQFEDKDVVFVDTAGRSPHHEEHMEELRQFIEIAKPDEIILVLSVTTDSNDLKNIYRKFNTIGIDKVIFTKLDETCSYGQILNTINEFEKPIAYLTTGQNVPDDIETPDPLYLAKMLLRKDEAL